MLKSERTAQQSVSKGTPRRVSVELGVTPTQGLPACLLIAGKNLGAVLDSEAGERRSRVVSAIQERDAGACSDRPVRAVLYRAKPRVAVQTRTRDTASWIVNSDAFRHAA